MYIPSKYKQEDKQSLIDTIKAIKIGALIIFSENQFFSAHIPFLVKEYNHAIFLEGHVSRANEIWKFAIPQNKAMVIFQGPNAYIHPGWYPTKATTGKVVPTWNYQVVHCHGSAENQQSEQWLLEHVIQLTDNLEEDKKNPWSVTDAPEQYIKGLIKGIVGIKIQVDKLEGALKMSQYQAEENRLGVIEGLSKSQNYHECEVAKMMQTVEAQKIIDDKF